MNDLENYSKKKYFAKTIFNSFIASYILGLIFNKDLRQLTFNPRKYFESGSPGFVLFFVIIATMYFFTFFSAVLISYLKLIRSPIIDKMRGNVFLQKIAGPNGDPVKSFKLFCVLFSVLLGGLIFLVTSM